MLERWRRRHGGPGRRIPEDLWDLAVEVAEVEGVPATARALRLDVARLEERMMVAQAEGSHNGEHSRLKFVKLEAAEVGAVGRSAVDVVSAAGNRLHIDTRCAGPLGCRGACARVLRV